MPRVARKKSETGIYHVVMRGINKQRIFEDDEDYRKFLSVIKKSKSSCDYEIYAYCLMDNHIHLLLKEGEEELGSIFKRIGASFVYWYNWKYSRSGHLFQDRYRSEVVEQDKYFLAVLRYIHQNPVKEGISELEAYPWSSYNEYIRGHGLCDVFFPLSLFSEDINKALKQFKEFHQKENADKCLEYDTGSRLTDREAAGMIKSIAKIDSPKEILNFDTKKRNDVIKKAREQGLSMRQIQRLTGVSISSIRRH